MSEGGISFKESELEIDGNLLTDTVKLDLCPKCHDAFRRFMKSSTEDEKYT